MDRLRYLRSLQEQVYTTRNNSPLISCIRRSYWSGAHCHCSLSRGIRDRSHVRGALLRCASKTQEAFLLAQPSNAYRSVQVSGRRMEVVIVLSVSVLTELIVTPPPVRGGTEYCDKRVCLFVCPRAYLRNCMSNLHQFFCTYVVRSSSGGVAIRYVLPFLWMTQFYNQKYV